MDDRLTTLDEALKYYNNLTPDRVFVYHRDSSFTYREIYNHVTSLASFMQTIGVTPGDKICLMLPRVPELIVAFLAASRIGALVIPVNFLLTSASVKQFITKNKPKVLISCESVLSVDLREHVSSLSDVIRITTKGSEKNLIPWREVISNPQGSINHLSKPDDIAYLNFTTGSSGEPKAAMATHKNLYWNTRSVTELFDMDYRDNHLCMFAPFAHPHELFARALYTGASITLLQEINPKTIVKTINRHDVTCIMGLAVMFEAIAAHCGNESIESLRIVESGGMYTREEVNLNFLRFFGRPIYSVWGSTETSGVAIANSPLSYRTDGSMGKVCPYYDIKLMNDETEVKVGEIGELYFRGPGLVSGYQSRTTILDDDGWYASGDLAKQDNDGSYHFIDRKSGMIKYAGLKIYPQQVENVLLDHPDVVEAAVVGIKDRKKGAVPTAYIKVNGTKNSVPDILEFCHEHLPKYMIPKGIIILDNLPKIGSGKINRKALLESLNS